MAEPENEKVTGEDISRSYADLKATHEAQGKKLTTAWKGATFRGTVIDHNGIHAVQTYGNPDGNKVVAHIDPEGSLNPGEKVAVSYNSHGQKTVRTPEEQRAFDKQQFADMLKSSFAQLKTIARDEMGDKIKVGPPVEGYTYTGEIIGKTDIQAVQRYSSDKAVVHTFRSGVPQMEVGETYKVDYTNMRQPTTEKAQPFRAQQRTQEPAQGLQQGR